MKNAILFFILALALAFVGCAKTPATGSKDANANVAPVETIEPVEQSDGSQIMTVTSPNGIKSEVRHFSTGVLVQISRAIWPDGRRAVSVRFRDGRAVDLYEAADIEQAMTASSETMAAIALKAMGASGNQPSVANSNQPTDKKEEKKSEKQGDKK
jgi:hypothetical protein